MLPDFIRAIAEEEDIDTVAHRLRDRLGLWYDRQMQRINSDAIDANAIRMALEQQDDTIAYQIAAAFLKDAQDAERQKPADQRRLEHERQEIEQEYIRRKTEELRRMRENARKVGPEK